MSLPRPIRRLAAALCAAAAILSLSMMAAGLWYEVFAVLRVRSAGVRILIDASAITIDPVRTTQLRTHIQFHDAFKQLTRYAWLPRFNIRGPSGVYALIPLWLIALTSAATFAALIRSLRRDRDTTPRCPHCRYPRSGLPDPTTPCPECGHTSEPRA